MNNLKVGFARVDNTPPLLAPVDGYTFMRYSEGVLDNLEINTVAISDGERQVLFISIDIMLIHNEFADTLRKEVRARTGIDTDAIYITATHTHTAPGSPRSLATAEDTEEQKAVKDLFFSAMVRKVADSAVLALHDMRPAKMGYGIGKAENVSFCRRFRMKDGSCQTNPGVGNPNIDHAMGEVDTRVSVIRFDREHADNIVIVNFANHPDTVGGSMISADWPGAMRRTVETVFDGVKCVFCNGAQGDINHVNVNPTGGYSNGLFRDFDDVDRGYEHTQYIGRVVAAGVMQAYDKVEYKDVERIDYLVKTILVPANKPTAEELPEAKKIWKLHEAGRDDELPYEGMMLTTVVAEARRMVQLADAPENFEMNLIGIKIGDVAFVGIPGEPFSDVGTQLKLADNVGLVVPTCITNGYQGYFPTFDAYAEGGYESRSSLFRAGVAERIIAGGIELIKDLVAKGNK